VLRHSRLGDPEPALHNRRDVPGGALTVGEQLEESPAYRVTQDVEG
jgi:hypothetical protein